MQGRPHGFTVTIPELHNPDMGFEVTIGIVRSSLFLHEVCQIRNSCIKFPKIGRTVQPISSVVQQIYAIIVLANRKQIVYNGPGKARNCV